jgi:hypothetical protein
LIARTHKAGLKLIIDIVPNHIARKYEGKTIQKVKDFGVNDDVTVAYKEIITSIIFYFEVPEAPKPLNAENHPLSDGKFSEVLNGLEMVLRRSNRIRMIGTKQ